MGRSQNESAQGLRLKNDEIEKEKKNDKNN